MVNNMKEIYMEKEDAVSPVIATILMVAITVVLAATVYILVSHYTSVGATTPLTGSLAVINEGHSNVFYYNLTFTFTTPTSITNLNNFKLTINGTTSANFEGNSALSSVASSVATSANSASLLVDYIIFNPDGTQVSSGGTIESGATIIIISNHSLSGGTVSISYTGYSGTVSTTLP